MTTELKDLYLAQCEQWIIGQRSAAQYLLGINDIYGWMICAGSKLQSKANWEYRKNMTGYIDSETMTFGFSEPVKTGQDAKDAHLDELRRGWKAYPRIEPGCLFSGPVKSVRLPYLTS